MSDNRIQRIVTHAQKIAACEREIAELIEMISLLNTQTSSCRLIVQDLRAAADEGESPTRREPFKDGKPSASELPEIRACSGR